jgi:hypothetical protein
VGWANPPNKKPGDPVQTAITFYLIYASILGPAGSCCCEVERICSAVRTATLGLQTPAPFGNESSDGSCPHCAKHGTPARGTSGGEPGSEGGNDGCPCRNLAASSGLPSAEVELVRTHLLTQSRGQAVYSDAPAAYPMNSTADVSATAACSGDRPFLGTDDLLHAHHLLRC